MGPGSLMRYFLFILLLMSYKAFSSIDDYLPVDTGPTSTNFGETGLLEMPTARLMPEGTLKIGFNSFFPYEVTSMSASPFSWMEAVFRYTEIKNQKYGPASYSGNQTLKDKSFDVKFRLLRERTYLPSIALGLRDLAGTGLFSSEYIVASKQIDNFDFTLGVAWGALGRDGNINNPFKAIHDSFNERSSSIRGLGGGFNVRDWFSGENAALYGGLEYKIKRYGMRVKLEYDTSNQEIASLTNGVADLEVDSRINFGLTYPIGQWGEISAGRLRGNQYQFSFHFKSNFNKAGWVPKRVKPRRIEQISQQEKEDITKSKRSLYRIMTEKFNQEQLYMQAATVSPSKVQVSINQNKYRNYALAAGRTARVLSSVVPPRIETLEIAFMNPNNTEINNISLKRKEFEQAVEGKRSTEELLKTAKLRAANPSHFQSAEFKPLVILPAYNWKMGPALKSHIGGPEAFFLGQAWWRIDFVALLARGLSIKSTIGLDIYNNFNQFNNPSYSEIPHVRSDVQDYLKEGANNIANLKLEYIFSPFEGVYARLDIGLMEEMFGGIGGEVLYKPFDSDTAIGFVLHRVRQRDYDQRFSFRDYETTTGHLELFQELPQNITAQILIGKYLAGDKGVTLDLSRRFNSGFRLGIFATKTNLSAIEFGEGSFDKGFYFQIPVDLFFPDYRTGNISFGLHPLTKDGGAILYGSNTLWGILGNMDETGLLRDWDQIID
tara:strand:+ start:4421 stop:6577 length:2157 start_codon:yes stop_codon:yes gene_type:complete